MTSTQADTSEYQGTLTRLTDSANAVDWWRWMLRGIGAFQFMYAAAIGAGLLFGTRNSLGVLGFLERDTGISPAIIGILFVFGMGQATRGVFPRYHSLLVIIGQIAYSLVTVVYTLRGELPLSGLASHGGLCVLCALCIVSATQRHDSPRRETPFKDALMPAMGVSLLMYAIGLAGRPDAAIATFIQGESGAHLSLLLAVCLGYGGGCILFNHILAKWLFTAMMPQYFYTLIAIALFFAHPLTTSLTGVVSHIAFAMISAFIILIQTDYSG